MAATTGSARAAFVARAVDGDERVKPLELFFDLVFVFAITQVTGMLSEDPTWAGLARGLLVLGVLWWAWVAYAWLTNTVDPEEGFVRLAMFAAMAAMLVVSLAAPEAFDDEALLFGVGYFLVRALHIVLYAIASRGNPDLRGAVVRLALPMLGAALVIIVAGFTDGWLQGALWVAALVVDFGGVVVGGMEGWSVSPGHFAERHGLIVIIALGESIVAVGVGASGLDIDAGVVAATVLGVGVAAALWWAYFDVVAPVAQRRLRRATGVERASLARDSYSFLHLPMVAGIVLVALGIKETLGDVDGHLETIPALGLCGGVSLYLLGHVLFRLRNVHTLNRQRLVVLIGVAAFTPLACPRWPPSARSSRSARA